MAPPSIPENSQYHHFISRFILRNFAHPFKPAKSPPDGSARRNRRRRRGGYHPGEPMLHAINLADDTADLIETRVSRTFGLTDMYRDFTDATNQHSLEEQLSRLESQAGRIITTIRKAFEKGQQDVWITRPDRDLLRKFLFIMKYWGSRMHELFNHPSADDYSADDREDLLSFMREKGYKTPMDVWFSNIKGILELEMDPKREWMEKLEDRIYPNDAKWYAAHTQMMYLALCTPSGQDEFLLTENAYSIHEGPVSFMADPDTKEPVMTAYTEFHVFAVISPKLMIVLRSFLLPILEEDSNQEIKSWREKMYQLNTVQHNSPSRAKSILEYLPVTKARNSYTRLVDGRIKLIDGEDGSLRSDHKFCFRFFPISTEHVNKINCIMLEQSYHTSKIVFNSKPGVLKTLEYYLSMPCQGSGTFGFKSVGDAPNDPRLVCLKKLEQAAKKLGSNITATYRLETFKPNEEEELEALGQMLTKGLPKEPSEFMKLYMRLGGNASMVPKDLDQAAKMLNMRIKIDVWTRGLDESFRDSVRENLRHLFCQLPARRVWYYCKRIRYMLLKDIAMVESPLDQNRLLDGPEDVIVNGKYHLDEPRMMPFLTSPQYVN